MPPPPAPLSPCTTSCSAWAYRCAQALLQMGAALQGRASWGGRLAGRGEGQQNNSKWCHSWQALTAHCMTALCHLRSSAHAFEAALPPPILQLIITHITARASSVRDLLAAQGLVLRQPGAGEGAADTGGWGRGRCSLCMAFVTQGGSKAGVSCTPRRYLQAAHYSTPSPPLTRRGVPLVPHHGCGLPALRGKLSGGGCHARPVCASSP